MSDSAADKAVRCDYLSPHEFVALSGLSLATVRRYVAVGRLPSVQPGGRRCRVLIPVTALASISGVNPVDETNQINQMPAAATPALENNKRLPGPKAKWRSRN